MQNKSVKITVCALSAALLFSGMNIQALAKEGTSLPSAGIDFSLSTDGTSAKSIKEEEEADSRAEKEDSETEAASTESQATSTPNLKTSITEIPEVKPEKIIEETKMATTTKTVPEKEREIAAKKEEEGFKSLVIANVNDYVNVRSIPSEEGEILGKLYDDSVGEFISEEDGWYQIKSGSVTGYVKAEYCVTGEDAVALARQVGTRIAKVTTTTLYVRQEATTESPVLGMVPIDDELLVMEEMDGWAKVNIEEGDGYVSLDYVALSTEFVKAESKAEEEARLAKEEEERRKAQEAARAKRAAVSKSSDSGSKTIVPPVISDSGSDLGRSVADFACQFVGNPYVYGGSSLTNGTDCSGFVMSVYGNYGVSLPHSSAADRRVGSAVDGLENAQPGDIICYSGHVGIYIGGGQIVHASNERTGIIISNASYRSILSIRRIF